MLEIVCLVYVMSVSPSCSFTFNCRLITNRIWWVAVFFYVEIE